MLSSEFWHNFLPAGKDFTIPAPKFLPAGIPFLELPKQRQSVRRFHRFDSGGVVVATVSAVLTVGLSHIKRSQLVNKVGDSPG